MKRKMNPGFMMGAIACGLRAHRKAPLTITISRSKPRARVIGIVVAIFAAILG